MYGRCVALLVVMAFAVTAHAEDVTPNQMARTVDDLDAVEFIQEGDEMEAGEHHALLMPSSGAMRERTVACGGGEVEGGAAHPFVKGWHMMPGGGCNQIRRQMAERLQSFVLSTSAGEIMVVPTTCRGVAVVAKHRRSGRHFDLESFCL